MSWWLPVPEWKNFLEFWEIFVIISLNILGIPLACTSSSSMPMILWFGFLMEFLHIPFTALDLFD
jgi:hypothetical protein